MSNDTKEFKGAFIADPSDNTRPKSLSEISIDWKKFESDSLLPDFTKTKKFKMLSQVPYRVMVNAAKIVVKCKDGEDYIIKTSKEVKNQIKLDTGNILTILDDIESILGFEVIIFEKDLDMIYALYLSYLMYRSLETAELNTDSIEPLLGKGLEIKPNPSRVPMLSVHVPPYRMVEYDGDPIDEKDILKSFKNYKYDSKYDKRVRNRQKLYNKRKRLGRKL